MRPAGIVYQWTQTPVSGFIGRRFKVLKSTSFATKKVNAFQVNFSEFNNKLVAAFTTNGVENSVSFHCLTFFFLLWMLKNTFTTFPVSFQVFWCLEHTTNCFIFSKSGLKYPNWVFYCYWVYYYIIGFIIGYINACILRILSYRVVNF